MTRIIAILAALALTACQNTRPPPIASGPVRIEGFDAAGNATMTSYAGRTSAGGGQVSDTTEAEILAKLADKLEGKEFTYASATRSAVEQPNVTMDKDIEDKHKAALQDLAQAAAAGAAGQYAKAASEVASLGGQLFAARAARAAAPKPDSGAITTRVLSSGDGHGLVAAALGKEFGETLRASQRATYSAKESTKTTDTTTAADINALADAIKEARLAAEAARLAAQPIQLPPAAPGVIALPVPAVTNAAPPVVVSPGTNVVETIVLPEFKP